jgi:hypothetical protein
MTKGLLTSWLTLVALSCSAQLSHYSLDFEVSASNFVDSIAIEWTGGQVYVPVSIEGKSYRFLFDTGSGQAVVYQDKPIMGCQPAGHIIAVDAIGRRDTVEMVKLPPLTLGTVTFTGCQATLQKRYVKRKDIDGIIGFDIIAKGLNAKIDVQNRLLILSDRKNYFDHEEGFETRYKLNYHVPYVEINPFGRFREPTLFDTGSRQFYSINRESFEKGMHGATAMMGVTVEEQATGRHAIGSYGSEPEGKVLFLTLDAMKWGDFIFSDVSVMTSQGGSHLGAAVLKYGAVVFNPLRRKVFFQPYNNGAFCNVSNQPLDIAFIAENGRPVVGLVREGSIPFQAGLRSGDTILSIDNRPVTSFHQFMVWPFLKGRTYQFTVRSREGQVHHVDWVRLP